MPEDYRQIVESIKDPIDRQLYAAEVLTRVYLSPSIDWDLALEAVAVCISVHCDRYQKRAARIVLNWFFGRAQANSIIEAAAIVDSRNDALIGRWKRKVLQRDGFRCRRCGETKNLHVHHISRWSDDPVNRINVDNGITLCGKCHAEEHAGERAYKLLTGADQYEQES